MAVTTKEEALDAIGDSNLSALRDVVRAGQQAWELLRNESPAVASVLSTRSRASVVYDAMKSEAVRLYETQKLDCHLNFPYGYVELVFSGQVAVRFKKYRDEGLGLSYIPTAAAEEWMSGHQSFPGMPEPVSNLVVGYTLDLVADDIGRIAITHRVEDVLQWEHTFEPADSGAASLSAEERDVALPAIRSTKKAADDAQEG